MTLNNAQKFVEKVMTDNNFRKSFYEKKSMDEIEEALRNENLLFNYGHFEDAINHKIGKAQDESEANQYRQIEGWWNMILKDLVQKEV